jgi:hypothetical protein
MKSQYCEPSVVEGEEFHPASVRMRHSFVFQSGEICGTYRRLQPLSLSVHVAYL